MFVLIVKLDIFSLYNRVKNVRRHITSLFNIPPEEENAPVGKRLPVMDEERNFQRNTLQREEENYRRLQHLDSQTSIDEGSINLSLNDTKCETPEGDVSLDTMDSSQPPQDQTTSPQPSRDQVPSKHNVLVILTMFLVTSYVPTMSSTTSMY